MEDRSRFPRTVVVMVVVEEVSLVSVYGAGAQCGRCRHVNCNCVGKNINESNRYGRMCKYILQ